MRHYPAYCSDCSRLWLVATQDAPSASPTCPRCQERGRLVPGAYYSDPASVVFIKLEQSLVSSGLGAAALGRLAGELEQLLPSPTETEIEQSFNEVTERLGLREELSGAPGKRVVLRMIVTIASTLSQPVIRESGVMRLPQTIKGLFDLAPREPPSEGSKSER
ncbi:MAG TPA: hypothetical protein VHB79_01160 [Polyangiaceae bacterium]|nr:hypothetical protein [Polyangiaceae bacterium]